MKILVRCLFFVFLSMNLSYGRQDSNKLQSVNKIHSQITSTLTHKYDMRCSAIGNAMMYEVEWLSWTFFKKGTPTEDEARRMIVSCMEDALKIINSDPNIKPYLIQVPFTNKNIHLSIVFENRDRSMIMYPEISGVSSINGIIYYDTNLPETPVPDELKNEQYDEAKRRVAFREKEQ